MGFEYTAYLRTAGYAVSTVFFVVTYFALLRTLYIQHHDEDIKDDSLDGVKRWSITGVAIVIPFIAFVEGIRESWSLLNIGTMAIIYVLLNRLLKTHERTKYSLEAQRDMTNSLLDEMEDRKSELEDINRRLEEELTTDPLTGLFNRRKFLDTLDERIDQGQAGFAVIIADLNRFKVINDTHGHCMGDKVLSVIAERFRQMNRSSVVYARIGGDEFGMIYDYTDTDSLTEFVEVIAEIIKSPIAVGEYLFATDVSIGVAKYPEDGASSEALMQHGDMALFHAKDNGKTDVMYSQRFIHQLERRNYIEMLLRSIDFDDSFELHYQPQFHFLTGELVGMEALLRWYHDEEGYISPAEFIPICEEIGLIQGVTDWVFETGMAQIAHWNNVHNMELVMNMNISPISFDNVGFISRMHEQLTRHGLDPEWIGLEITEHSAMNTATRMEEFLTALSGIGLEIAIDDFGTGYSSLAYLKRFDVDVLKIAKELIDGIETDFNELLIVKAIIMMAEGMGIKTLAEGVETEKQYQILRELNCTMVQGYYTGKPVKGEIFEEQFIKEAIFV